MFCSESREIERSCLPSPLRQGEVAKIKFGIFKTWIQKKNWEMKGVANHGILDDCWAVYARYAPSVSVVMCPAKIEPLHLKPVRSEVDSVPGSRLSQGEQ